jgi:sucrose phosphorylase
MKTSLLTLYTRQQAAAFIGALEKYLAHLPGFPSGGPQDTKSTSRPKRRVIEEACLICYADTVVDRSSGKTPLQVLKAFLKRYRIPDRLNTLHILPFFPWDTDRGFSVTNYYQVHPDYGSWADMSALAQQVFLMFDFVINHASIQNPLIQSALIERHLPPDDPRYIRFAPFKNFVIAFSDEERPSEEELQRLIRPRPTPVLTPYAVLEKKEGRLFATLGRFESTALQKDTKVLGTGWVWTTFSRPTLPDQSTATRQVDLNFKNPAVLLEAAKILFYYIGKGASRIRLDAVAYLWKNAATPSIHEPQTHAVIRILRRLLKRVSPGTSLVAEVNEPQDQILPYLGRKGRPECDLVYQFTHFPLAVYSVLTGDGRPYTRWLNSLAPFDGRQFITILGSHDGMGLKPAHGWLTPEQRDALVDTLVLKHGALPNYAALPGGETIVYEVCATPWHLINNSEGNDPIQLCIARYLAVVALGFLVRGVPAFYINGLIGAENAPRTGLDENRSINRQRFDVGWLFDRLDGGSRRMKGVMEGILNLLEIRRKAPAFHPRAPAAVPLFTENPGVVCAWMQTRSKQSGLMACISVSKKNESVKLPRDAVAAGTRWKDLLSGKQFAINEKEALLLELDPYQVLWLKPLRNRGRNFFS